MNFVEADIYGMRGEQARLIHDGASGNTHLIFADNLGKEFRMQLALREIDTISKFVEAINRTPVVQLANQIKLIA